MTDPIVGIVAHSSSLVHDAGERHPESPERITAIRQHLTSAGLDARLSWHEPEPAPAELIHLAHSRELLNLLTDIEAAGGGRIDLDTAMGPGSLDATLRASQGAVDATDRVLDGAWASAFVCMRPPGHHATPVRPMGFCLTNHIAVAARWAVTSGRASRVLIVDWDAHHGNGTQDIFWTDPDVLYVSLHQYPWYPGTGDVTEVGEGPGRGTTLNVPLPAGAAEDAYDQAFEVIVEPAARSFRPDIVLVSAGYDAHALDPLCMMRLTAGGFFRLARRVRALGPGPVCVLEGGYDLGALASSTAATLSALLDDPEPVGLDARELGKLSGEPDAARWVGRAAEVWAQTSR